MHSHGEFEKDCVCDGIFDHHHRWVIFSGDNLSMTIYMFWKMLRDVMKKEINRRAGGWRKNLEKRWGTEWVSKGRGWKNFNKNLNRKIARFTFFPVWLHQNLIFYLWIQFIDCQGALWIDTTSASGAAVLARTHSTIPCQGTTCYCSQFPALLAKYHRWQLLLPSAAFPSPLQNMPSAQSVSWKVRFPQF